MPKNLSMKLLVAYLTYVINIDRLLTKILPLLSVSIGNIVYNSAVAYD